MATPKPLIQKLAVFQNDSFNSWMQKTDATAREVGDLNNISTNLLAELVSQTILPGTLGTLLSSVTKTGATLVGGTNQITVDTTGLHPKMPVSGDGNFIIPGTEIVSIVNETTVQINQNISGSPSGTHTLVFAGVPNMLIGSNTTFTTAFIVGDTVRITPSAPLNVLERRVVSIIDNTRILVDASFKTPAGDVAFTGATYENLRSLNLVAAINHTYEQEIRRSLIRAIAMS
jgi:hypothetical protein